MKTGAKWQDWASFALGLWLAVSPWALGFAEREAATANAAFVGLALALGSHFEVSFDELRAEWFNLSAGAWLLFAPFLLGFSEEHVAAVDSLVVGAAVTLLAFSALGLDRPLARPVPRRHASR